MIIAKEDKEYYFNTLLESADSCNLCSRMCNRKKVLSKYNGNIHSKVMFIAEAPGRLGAECTGIPLYGDRTGDTFELLLSNIGWNRNDVFVTNSILCNPQDENGNNSTPVKEEIINCSALLEMTINLVNPEVIVTLGIKALDALKVILKHSIILKEDVATFKNWNGYKVYPLYHMGPRALIHRKIINQRADYINLSHKIDPLKGFKKQGTSIAKITPESTRLISLSKMIVDNVNVISLFKLTKLIYLIDYTYLSQTGHSISNSIFLRMKQGPWIPSLFNLLNASTNLFKVSTRGKLNIISRTSAEINSVFSSEEIKFINSQLDKYKNYTEKKIKITAYLTPPMKFILAKENDGEDMSKVPVIYNDATVEDFYNKGNKPKQITIEELVHQ